MLHTCAVEKAVNNSKNETLSTKTLKKWRVKNMSLSFSFDGSALIVLLLLLLLLFLLLLFKSPVSSDVLCLLLLLPDI